MNKISVKQKRSLGKNSPLSKRSKLDFSLTARDTMKQSSDTEEPTNACKKGGNCPEKEKGLSSSDWDDDFSGDMLEKVCLIADLSQAMVNNQSVPELEKEEINFFKNKLSPKSIHSITTVETAGSYEKLKLELEKLQDKLKTKEGEVYILRSQLKQNEDAKQGIALQNIKIIEEIQQKYNDKFNLIKQELESTRSKLLFRDLECKSLGERCRQLEYNLSKSKLAERKNSSKPLNCLCQVALRSKETFSNKHLNLNGNNVEDERTKFEYFIPVYHEGKNLARMLCPEFFKYVPEPSIVPIYFYCSETENHKNKIYKAEKCNWKDLPKQTVHIKDLYKDVSSLFTFENFTRREVIKIIRTILNGFGEILHHQNQVFKFLDKTQLCNIEYEKADRCLLEKEEKSDVITVKNLLNCEKLGEEECGIELRRSLGLIYSLMEVSKTAFDMVKTNVMFIKLFKDIVASIGKLRRPLRYTGVLVGISLILQKLLEEKSLGKGFLTLITETVEEMILARPKLDVLREVLNVLSAGKHHPGLLTTLCKRESVDSCMLYMDCKLKHAMFFTKNACPLKLLCMQIMGLACLPCNKNMKWDVTECVIKWLNNSLSTEISKNIEWLPVHPDFMEEDGCFNVTECLLYLLVLCLNDYNLNFPLPQDSFDKNTTVRKKKTHFISIIGRGAVLFKRILKADQRQLHENYSLRFSALLKTLMPNKSVHDQWRASRLNLSSVEVEAISWINDLRESDLRMQDCCLKQNFSTLSDIDAFNALRINDETKIF